MHNPFFILGFPRSGTTILRLLLNRHSRLTVPPECSFITWLEEDFGDWARQDCSSERLDSFVSALSAARKFNSWNVKAVDLKRAILRSEPPSYQKLVGEVYRQFAVESEKDILRWGDKNNVYLHQYERILRLFPRAQIIWIVRDVRDVFASILELQTMRLSGPYQPLLSNDPDQIGGQWVASNQKIFDLKESAGPETVIRVRYEDLVQAPEQTLSAVYAFLRVQNEFNSIGAPGVWSSREQEPAELRAWKQKTTEPLSADSVGRFRKDLSITATKRLEHTCANLLTTLGYPK